MKYRENFFILLYLATLLFLADCYNTDVVIILASLTIIYFFLKYGIYKKIILMLSPLILITVIGILVSFFYGKSVERDTVRDIYKTLCPVIFILLGFYLYEYEKVGKNYFWKSILIASYLISIRHFFLILLNILEYGISFETIRGVGGNMSMTTLVSFIAVTFLKDRITFLTTRSLLTSKLLFGLSIILYLSRTMLIILLSFFIIFSLNYIRKSDAMKIFKLFVWIIIFLFIFLFFRNSSIVVELTEKFSKAFTEISSKNEYWDWISINNNWRGYEIFLVRNEMSNADLLSKLFGFGFGSLLRLGVTIKLGTELFSAIPVLHNGYYYILFKTGYIGLLMLFIFFSNGITKIVRRMKYSNKNKSNMLFLLCTYVAIALSMYVISGFYNGVTLLSLCEVIGYYERKIRDEN